jgi:hypothetical protein
MHAIQSGLRYLCLFAYCGVQRILCSVFILFFLRLAYPMLPVSLDCPFLLAPLVSFNVYLTNMVQNHSFFAEEELN